MTANRDEAPIDLEAARKSVDTKDMTGLLVHALCNELEIARAAAGRPFYDDLNPEHLKQRVTVKLQGRLSKMWQGREWKSTLTTRERNRIAYLVHKQLDDMSWDLIEIALSARDSRDSLIVEVKKDE